MTPRSTSESTPAESSPGHVTRRIQRWRGQCSETLDDAVAEERPIAMRYNERSFAVMMASPVDLDDFALGFSLSEGLINHAAQLLNMESRFLLEGIELAMTVATDAPVNHTAASRERLLSGRSGCGICGTRELEDAVRQPARVERGVRIGHAAIESALAALAPHQSMNQATGAVHAAAWSDRQGCIVLVREDVGRHNALDKLVGAMSRAGIHADEGFAIITSRASYEMVSKAASVGIGLLVAISAPTALAIELAKTAGITLVGFARPGSHNIYTHPHQLFPDKQQPLA